MKIMYKDYTTVRINENDGRPSEDEESLLYMHIFLIIADFELESGNGRTVF